MKKVEELLTLLHEALKNIDKKVIDAFYDKKSMEGKLLDTDGKTLEKSGMGGETVAKWEGNKIVIVSSSSVKSDEMILGYMKKSIPKGIFDEKSYKEYFWEWGSMPKNEKKIAELLGEEANKADWIKIIKSLEAIRRNTSVDRYLREIKGYQEDGKFPEWYECLVVRKRRVIICLIRIKG